MSAPAFLQGILSHERALFCNVVAAVPEDSRRFRCEPKVRSAEELIGHNLDLVELLNDGVIHHRNNVPFDSVEGAVATLDSTFGEIIDRGIVDAFL